MSGCGPQTRKIEPSNNCPLCLRLCCKSRFAQAIKNSKGRGCGFRVNMRGTSSPRAKLTGDFGNAIEAIRIGDLFSVHVLAKNSSPCKFRLLQHNPPAKQTLRRHRRMTESDPKRTPVSRSHPLAHRTALAIKVSCADLGESHTCGGVYRAAGLNDSSARHRSSVRA
jgi:hypothetical protein